VTRNRQDATPDQEWLARRFEADRAHLRGVAYRMLGSLAEADDAVQEAWIRLSTADASEVENLRAWLTTVVARVCLNILRSRRTRRESSLDARQDAHVADPIVSSESGMDPEQEAILGDSIGLALLAVLDSLAPAERVAFVLHDVFAVPFDEIAPIVGRSSEATRQLASRGRRRVRHAPVPDADLEGQWKVVDAFMAAARDGDFERLLVILDPDVVVRSDGGAAHFGLTQLTRGAKAVAAQALSFRRFGETSTRVLVNGIPGGIAWSPDGRPFAVMSATVVGGRIASIDVLADPDRLAQLDLQSL
jgi:RNA polymerase sigma-70 factor (ECF subfamily)